jgi:hypothetical protein
MFFNNLNWWEKIPLPPFLSDNQFNDAISNCSININKIDDSSSIGDDLKNYKTLLDSLNSNNECDERIKKSLPNYAYIKISSKITKLKDKNMIKKYLDELNNTKVNINENNIEVNNTEVNNTEDNNTMDAIGGKKHRTKCSKAPTSKRTRGKKCAKKAKRTAKKMRS